MIAIIAKPFAVAARQEDHRSARDRHCATPSSAQTLSGDESESRSRPWSSIRATGHSLAAHACGTQGRQHFGPQPRGIAMCCTRGTKRSYASITQVCRALRMRAWSGVTGSA